MASTRVVPFSGRCSEGLEGLLEERRRLAGRGTLGSAGAGLLAVGDSLVPYLASQGVMGQAFYLLVPPVAGQRFERLDNPRMQVWRRSWRRLRYATSWISACLKV